MTEVDRKVLQRTVDRLHELLPSFRDPSHYANHEDIAMVRHLESALATPDKEENND